MTTKQANKQLQKYAVQIVRDNGNLVTRSIHGGPDHFWDSFYTREAIVQAYQNAHGF